jgi:hypothetical protein
LPFAPSLGVFLLFLLLLAPSPARAEERVRFSNIRAAEGWIEVDLEIPGGLPPNLVETLERGVPATIVYEIEIWRSRSRWFDRLEATQFRIYRIEFDTWERVFRVRGPGEESERFPSREALEGAVLRPTGIRVVPLRRLEGGAPHYFAVRAGVKPLELEQVRNIEAWLEGKIPGDGAGSEAENSFFGIPERVFGFVAGLAGFGEETLEARSINFRPEGLE